MNDLDDRRGEEKDRRRNEIIDAVETVAAVVGIRELTMDQVARRARLSRALLYVYFKDKTDLQLGLCERGIGRLRERFERVAAAHGTGLERIVAMGREYLAFSRECPVYFEALSQFESVDDERDNPSFVGCMTQSAGVHQTMINAIESGQRDGSIAPTATPPLVIAMALWGCLHGVIQLADTKGELFTEYGISPDAVTQAALELARRGLAVTTAAPAPAAARRPKR